MVPVKSVRWLSAFILTTFAIIEPFQLAIVVKVPLGTRIVPVVASFCKTEPVYGVPSWLRIFQISFPAEKSPCSPPVLLTLFKLSCGMVTELPDTLILSINDVPELFESPSICEWLFNSSKVILQTAVPL